MDTTINNTRDGIGRALDSVIYFTPKLIAFLLILLVGYFVAKLIGGAIDKLLVRVGFDRMVERGGLKKAMGDSGLHVSDILSKVAFYTLFLFVMQLAFGVFGPNPISDLLTRVIAFLPNVFVSICIVVIASAMSAVVKQIVQAAVGGLSYGRTLANLAGVSILVVGIFAALSQLQIAPMIVDGLFYALLAVFVGVVVVGVGGGLIQPMRARWETVLGHVEQETPRVKEQIEIAKQGNQNLI